MPTKQYSEVLKQMMRFTGAIAVTADPIDSIPEFDISCYRGRKKCYWIALLGTFQQRISTAHGTL